MENVKVWVKVFLVALIVDIVCIGMHYIWPETVIIIMFLQMAIPAGIIFHLFNEWQMSFLEFIPNFLAALLIAGMGILTMQICSVI